MATPNYNLPTISGNMTADVVRDMNALAEATDSAIKEAIDNVDLSGINTKLDAHIKDELGHVRYVGAANGSNAKVITTDLIPMVSGGANPVPKLGVALRFIAQQANTGAVTLQIQTSSGNTLAYPLSKGDGKALVANDIIGGGIYTVAFSGSVFFLQGSGSGVKTVVRGSQTFATPGTHAFTVPDGVSKLTAYIFGAGGGGGGCINEYYGGGGGGAGAFMLASIDVTPGQVLDLAVGRGGVGPSGANFGAPGGSSGITILGLQYVAGGGGGGTYGGASGSPHGQGGQGGGWSRTGITGLVTNNDTPAAGAVYTFASAAPSNFLLSYSGGSGDAGKTPNYGGGGGGGPSDAQGGFAANSNTPGAEPSVYSNVKGGKGGKGDYKGSGDNGGLAAGGGGSASTVGKAGDGGNGKIILYW